MTRLVDKHVGKWTIEDTLAEIDTLRLSLIDKDIMIDGQRIKLAERDAELSARARLLFANEIKLATQRRVLEQALEALTYQPSSRQWPTSAVTAIQEVL